MLCTYIVRLMDHHTHALYTMNSLSFVRIAYTSVPSSFMYTAYYRYCTSILYIFIHVHIYTVRVPNSVKFLGVLVGLIFLMTFEPFHWKMYTQLMYIYAQTPAEKTSSSMAVMMNPFHPLNLVFWICPNYKNTLSRSFLQSICHSGQW